MAWFRFFREPAMSLPAPAPEALAHSQQLAELIRQEIRAAEGWISFAQFMGMALYAPGLGYYTAGARKFGAAGDFITAPELTPLFARALARQAAQVMAASSPCILEAGAGSGRLAADLLKALEGMGSLPERYFILDISTDLRQRQRELLAREVPQLLDRVEWLETLPESFSGLVLGNELLDAMPPWHGGGAMIDRVTFERTTYAPPPARFEAGTPHIVGAIALAAAVDYVRNIGVEAIHAHEAKLVTATRDALRSINSITLFGPDEACGIVSFAMQGVHPHDIGTILDEENVAIRAGHHCAQPLMGLLGVPATARASFGLYSDENDVEALVKGLDRVQRIFG